MDGDSLSITPVECKLIINTHKINIIYIKNVGFFMLYIISLFIYKTVLRILPVERNKTLNNITQHKDTIP